MNDSIYVVGGHDGFMLPILKNNFYTCYNVDNDELEGDSINYLNRFWSEYVCQYYVYKNNIKSDIVSFCHYNRVLKKVCIDYDRIINDNAIQYYSKQAFDLTKKIDAYGNKITEYNDEYFALHYHLIDNMNQPEFILNDLIEYLESQPFIDINEIKKITKRSKDYYMIRQELYSCSWDNFVKLQEFVCGYVDYITNKYKLDSLKKYQQHFLIKIIPHYRKFAKSKEFDKLLTTTKILYNQRNDFLQINNLKTYYGFDVRCNVWRVYSYIIELLISIYIQTHNNFISTNYKSALILK